MPKSGPHEWTPPKRYTSDLEKALGALLDFLTSGRSSETRNPYTVPEVQAAIKLLNPEVYERLYGPPRR